MNRKVAKVTKRRLVVFGPISIILIIYFAFTLSYYIYTLYDLNNQKHNLEEKYKLLQKDAEDLQIEINKLSDPEYLARYAREKYSYSKKGEYILKINEAKEEIKEIDNTINNNYIIIGLCCVIITIFIYIVIKSIKK